MEDYRTRARLGSQIAGARHCHGWTLDQVSRRTGRASARLSEMETGKANSTIDTLEAVGHVLNMQLMFVPDDKLREVLEIVKGRDPCSLKAPAIPSIFDEVFVVEDGYEVEPGAGV